MSKQKLTIIDGSSLVYSACYNTSINEEKTDDFHAYREALKYYIQNVLEVTSACKYVIYGDQASSYRKRQFESFKADRSKKPHMKFRNDLMHYANTELHFFNHPDLEADDMCLITHERFKDEYDITIASKDSDLRQYPAKFFNYGIFRKKDYKIEDGFEIITEKEAHEVLWRSVLTKGHNNKVDYLEGCGKETAKKYISRWKTTQLPYAVLRAFIKGIEKDEKSNIKRNVKGYNLPRGIDKFERSFRQTYLYRYDHELEELEIFFETPEFIDNPYML